MTRPRRYRRIITGGSATLSATGGGLGISSSLVATDAHHCQQLLSEIDNRDVFTMPARYEVPFDVVESVKQVRAMATSIEGLVDGEEVYEEVHNIARACRQFMRDYKTSMPDTVLAAALDALRAQVGESLGVLVRILNLRPTRHFDLHPYAGRSIRVIEGWLARDNPGSPP